MGRSSTFTGLGDVCSGSSGPDLTYQIDVPANFRAIVTLTPIAQWDLTLNLMAPLCTEQSTCVASSDFGGVGASETSTWWNTQSTTQSLFAVVDSASASSGDFTIAVSYDSPAQGDRCENPVPLINGAVVNKTFVGVVDDYHSTAGCLKGGPELIFSVQVGAGETVALTATPSASACCRRSSHAALRQRAWPSPTRPTVAQRRSRIRTRLAHRNRCSLQSKPAR